jgi:hypothetical protein
LAGCSGAADFRCDRLANFIRLGAQDFELLAENLKPFNPFGVFVSSHQS